MHRLPAFLAAIGVLLMCGMAAASQCIQLAGMGEARIIRAALEPGAVRIRFVGHSAFRIETDQGRVAVTDFYGDAGPGPTPDAVTMNRAHATHWTDAVPAAIPHALKGWGEGGEPAEHWLSLDDLLIRNITTDIRGWDGGWQRDGNSIFIFEYEGLCIGHLGHLHHQPTEAQYAMMGRLDVVLAPVDGGFTMPIDEMIEMMRRVRARVIIPMHIFRTGSLERFLAALSDSFAIDMSDADEVVLSAATLPAVPTIKVLAPAVRGGGAWGD